MQNTPRWRLSCVGLTHTDWACTVVAPTTTWTVTPTSNQVTSWKFGAGSSVPWMLDTAGNLISDGAGLTLSYGAKKRLVSTVNGGGTTLYAAQRGQAAHREGVPTRHRVVRLRRNRTLARRLLGELNTLQLCRKFSAKFHEPPRSCG